ncbi:MAG: hypothetical protein ACI9KE_002939 [Polyangiales bacterium]|jgi:hypothetical protein
MGSKYTILFVVLMSCAPVETAVEPLDLAEVPAEAQVRAATTPAVMAPVSATPAAFRPEDVTPTPSLIVPGEGAFDHDVVLEALRTASSREFKPVGHTSVVFRMRLEGEHNAAFRPRTRRHRRGHLAEVAAYALGRFLGLDNVVPATLRTESRRRISEHLHSRYDDVHTWEDLEERIFYRSPTQTPGAAIYWVPDLVETELDQGASRREWEGWLAGEDIPEERVALARDLSNVRVFDYLIGNWDRFSGGNLKLFGGEVERVALRDHNVAFGRVGAEREERLLSEVLASQRFSRTVLARLSQLDAEGLQGVIERFNSEEERRGLGLEILHPTQRDAVLERAAVVLSHVGALISAQGEDAVLYFD